MTVTNLGDARDSQSEADRLWHGMCRSNQKLEAFNFEMNRREARRLADLMEAASEDRVEFPAGDTSLTALLAEEIEPLEYRIHNLSHVGGNTTLSAYQKTGKSVMMMNLALSLVDGEPFLNQPVKPVTGNVAYWDFELQRVMVQHWFRTLGIRNTDKVHPLSMRGHSISLADDKTVEEIVTWMKAREVEAWIIDPTVHMCSWPGIDNAESDNPTVVKITQALDYIKREAGISDLFLTLHTGNQDKGRGRGAARWGDWPDSLWVQTGKQDDTRTFLATGRDVSFPTITLDYDPATHRITGIGDLEAMQEWADAKCVVDAVRKAGREITARDLRPLIIGVATDRKAAATQMATMFGWIKCRKDGQTHHYSLPENEG